MSPMTTREERIAALQATVRRLEVTGARQARIDAKRAELAEEMSK